MEKISIESILLQNKTFIDVRSPIEYRHGHIPTAQNLPLFTDEERKIVGTTYKQCGKREAIEKGLELISFQRLLQQIHQLNLPSSLYVYCARGGMRSSSMGWLLNLLGYEIYVIEGGYKSFRRWRMKQLSFTYSFRILGGETGSGKTKILKDLALKQNNVIDLEAIANHRGSVFGRMGEQPSQEHFENELALQLYQKKEQTIWLEDESQKIGSVMIPNPIFKQMRTAPLFRLQIPKESRIQECLAEYQSLGQKELSAAILRLQKKLGTLATQKALDALNQNNLRECCAILLQYYDKKYQYGMSRRDPKTITIMGRQTMP